MGDTALASIIQNDKQYQPFRCYRRSPQRSQTIVELSAGSLYQKGKCVICCGKNSRILKIRPRAYVSTQMPYFTTETGAFLDSRQHRNDSSDLRSLTMWKLVDEYGPQSTVKEKKNTIRIPQTLDESYFATNRSLEGQDIDQVIYRYTKKADNKKAKLLMINQVWMWQVVSK